MDCNLPALLESKVEALSSVAAKLQDEVNYYKGLLRGVASAIGRPAYIAPDGLIRAEPQWSKLPEIVKTIAVGKENCVPLPRTVIDGSYLKRHADMDAALDVLIDISGLKHCHSSCNRVEALQRVMSDFEDGRVAMFRHDEIVRLNELISGLQKQLAVTSVGRTESQKSRDESDRRINYPALAAAHKRFAALTGVVIENEVISSYSSARLISDFEASRIVTLNAAEMNLASDVIEKLQDQFSYQEARAVRLNVWLDEKSSILSRIRTLAVTVLRSDRDATEDEPVKQALDKLAAEAAAWCNRYETAGRVGRDVRSPDKNVEGIRSELLSRSVKGLQKYGVTTERDDLTLRAWLQHLKEELLDASVYSQRVLTWLDNKTESLDALRHAVLNYLKTVDCHGGDHATLVELKKILERTAPKGRDNEKRSI